MDAHEVKNALNDEAQAVAQMLLPNGVEERNEWCVGSINGEEGRSLKVCINGRKKGTWKDFASGDGGSNLLELWSRVKGITFVDAYIEAKKYLGVYDDVQVSSAKDRAYDKLKIEKGWAKASNSDRALKYFERIH